MASFWKNLLGEFFASSPETERNSAAQSQSRNPNQTIADQPRADFFHYPKTFQASADISNDGEEIFEPALLHFSRAFRHGDPEFENAEEHQKWHDSKRQMIDHLLHLIDASKWREHLVLRGSLLLKAWLGERAREPGDIDWVFRPSEIVIKDLVAIELFDDLIKMVSENPTAGDVFIEIEKIATDDIWTYERAAGKRIVFPWKTAGLPPGAVQMDVVFNERLWTEPVQTLIPNYRDSSRAVWTVDQEISLAWKILWLETDMYPQGKDLYDAALLAEQTDLSLELLRQVLESGDWRSSESLSADFPLKWEIDWNNFKLEYPWVEGTASEWQQRLTNALAPTFEPDNLNL